MTDSMVAQLFHYAAYTPDYRKDDPTAYPWLGHLTFANMLVREFPPKLLVELGTLYGVSFFSFCQAIAEAGFDAQAVAVDSWEGDSQAGFYGGEVFDSFRQYLDGHYAGFARCMRCYFDDAVRDFADESIDILHIDGLHTYEAVRHDFDTWLPKVRPGGIILFHDVCEVRDDFGAYKVWAEITQDSGEHFLFTHSHGLGVWRKPGGELLSSPFLKALLQRENPDAALIDAVLSNTAEKENFAFQLQVESQRLNTEIQRLNMELQRIEIENNHLLRIVERVAEEKSYVEASMQPLVEENAGLRQEITRFYNSRSWRITRPLRAAGKLLRQTPLFPLIKKFCQQYNAKVEHSEASPQEKKDSEGRGGESHSSGNSESKDSQQDVRSSASKKVSVIVPNYNHSAWLRERLESIYNQTYQNFEVFLLDDCSTDGSRAILEEYKNRYPEKTILVFNESNTGSPYKQWRKGLLLARGDLVWIAESDDSCQLNFLETHVKSFEDETVMLSYSFSQFVIDGEVKGSLASNCADCIHPDTWETNFVMTAHEFVNNYLALKNVIINVSSCVLRNTDFSIYDYCHWTEYDLCGDWVFYLHFIAGGKVAYRKDSINFYRIHLKSTSKSVQKELKYYKEHEKVGVEIATMYKVPPP